MKVPALITDINAMGKGPLLFVIANQTFDQTFKPDLSPDKVIY